MVSGPAGSRGVSALQWYALLGAPLAWAVQLVVGYFYTEAACGPADLRLGGGLHLPEAALTAAMVVIAAGGWAAAMALHRSTSRGTVVDPLGRVRFIADLGLVVGAIFVALILYTGAAETAVSGCR